MSEAKARAHAQTPFERFTDFARRVIAVPKKELDKKRRVYQRRKAKKRT